MTPHLASLGAIEISRGDYVALLGAAIDGSLGAAVAGAAAGDFGALDRLPDLGDSAGTVTVSAPPLGKDIVQLLTQTS